MLSDKDCGKKNIIFMVCLVTGLMIIIGIGLSKLIQDHMNKAKSPNYYIEVNSGSVEHRVFVEIADTPEKRANGLMNVHDLASDNGMLFIFPDNSNNPFWMKDCYIALDIIFIDQEGTITYIANSVKPCTDEPCELITSPKPFLYVLEVNAGWANQNGVNTGDKITFDPLPKQLLKPIH